MNKALLIISALLVAMLTGEEVETDPFGEIKKRLPANPQRLAPDENELKAFGEPVIKGSAQENSGDIRFIWIPTFNKPLSIRASKNGNEISMRIVRLSGKGGYDWGKIELQKTIPLSLDQWKQLTELAEKEGAREPSQLAVEEIKNNFADVMSGLDGAVWYLEVRDMNGYTVEGVPNPIVSGESDEKDPFSTIPDESKITIHGDADAIQKLKKNSNLDFRPFLAVCFKLFELSGIEGRPGY